MAVQKQVVLHLEKVALPGNIRISAVIAKGDHIGVILKTTEQRKALVRKILGFERVTEGVLHPEGAIATFSKVSSGHIRARVGTNLPTSDLHEGAFGGFIASRSQRKVESAPSLVEAFEIHLRHLLRAVKGAKDAGLFAGPRERFARWAANFGIRASGPVARLDKDGWNCFWLASAMAVGSRLCIFVDPFAGIDFLAARTRAGVLRLFINQEQDTACFIIAESNVAPLGVLCDRWIV